MILLTTTSVAEKGLGMRHRSFLKYLRLRLGPSFVTDSTSGSLQRQDVRFVDHVGCILYELPAAFPAFLAKSNWYSRDAPVSCILSTAI